ncbi:hypothetical protein BZA05DRAFT_476400, partial [Tricharina praecox]|uniref:uncharacterized protein n=1 Tax=Tricharina praecox TaxID=43433 RepID=UPI00221F18FA
PSFSFAIHPRPAPPTSPVSLTTTTNQPPPLLPLLSSPLPPSIFSHPSSSIPLPPPLFHPSLSTSPPAVRTTPLACSTSLRHLITHRCQVPSKSSFLFPRHTPTRYFFLLPRPILHPPRQRQRRLPPSHLLPPPSSSTTTTIT